MTRLVGELDVIWSVEETLVDGLSNASSILNNPTFRGCVFLPEGSGGEKAIDSR